MTAHIALCIDEMTMRNPETIGLDGELVDLQPWLDVYASGSEARRCIAASPNTREAWVVSCNDVEPINLAASLKADSPELRVSLVSFELCGSLLSRAHNALIDEVLERSAFVRRYGDEKRRALDGQGGFGEQDGDPERSKDGGELDGKRGKSGGSDSRVDAVAESTAVALPTVGDMLVPPPVAPALQTKPQPRPAAVRTSSRSFVLSVVSGSGGAGKSAVSALSALISKAGGRKTLLLDCDLQFGDVDAMVGVDNPLRIDEALANPDLLEREIAQEGRLAVLAAPARLETGDEVAHLLPELLERVSNVFDVVVANTGAAWAEQHAALVERSSVALFLIDQRASSVRACKHALELCARCGIATGPFQFALNRCAKGAPLTSVDVSCALQGAPVFELRDGGRDVEDYLSSGAGADLLEMKNEFAKSLEQVMERLLPGGIIEADVRVVSEPSRPLRRRRRGRR